MFNLVTVISSLLGARQASARTSQTAAGTSISTGASAKAAQGPTNGAAAAAQASAQSGNTSASTANAASAASSQGSVPSAGASSSTSASVAGVASADIGASGGVSAARSVSAAQSAGAAGTSLDRHFAIGMQKSAGAYAFDRLSDMVSAGSDASGVAASLESSQQRFRSLLSEMAASAPPQANDDQDAPSSAASTVQVQNAYADNAA